MLVIYKGYEKEYLEKEIKGSLIDNKVEEKINILKNLINQLRDMRSYTIKSDDLGEEELYYL